MEIKNLDSPIKVINISEGGIAFESKSMLPINFYFNAALNLGSETDTLYSVVKIIRSQAIEGTDNYLYGCFFAVLLETCNRWSDHNQYFRLPP